MTCGPPTFLPFTNVPFVDLRSRTMILPSLTTILVCFLEMLPLGRQMSFSSTRPMVISSHSKSSRCVGPPFSVRMTLNDIWLGPPPEAQEYLAVVPRSKRRSEYRRRGPVHASEFTMGHTKSWPRD